MSAPAASTARAPASAGGMAAPARGRLQVQGLAVTLGERAVLQGVDLALRPGWTALVGPNGAGKSTLLRALAGLQKPAAGQVRCDGEDLLRLPPAERARRIAWLAQQGEAGGELSVRETVALGRIAHLGLGGLPGPADAAAVDDAMALTGCSAAARRRLQELSGGERQRVLLARVLATGAPTLLLDEPTTHLDPSHQLALARLIARLAHDPAQPRCLLTVLHDLPIALQADRLVVLCAGRIRADGPPGDRGVQAALVAAFEGAIRLETGADGRPQVGLAFGPGFGTAPGPAPRAHDPHAAAPATHRSPD